MKYETEQAAVKLAAAILIAVAVTCGGCKSGGELPELGDYQAKNLIGEGVILYGTNMVYDVVVSGTTINLEDGVKIYTEHGEYIVTNGLIRAIKEDGE